MLTVVDVSQAGRNFCYLGARFNSFHYKHPKITYYGSNKTSPFYPVLYLNHSVVSDSLQPHGL